MIHVLDPVEEPAPVRVFIMLSIKPIPSALIVVAVGLKFSCTVPLDLQDWSLLVVEAQEGGECF
eukprot:8431102-Prorocentrum_lima.AAC.1